MKKACCFFLVVLGACGTTERHGIGAGDTLVVFEAASLAAPMRAVLDTFARAEHVVIAEEHGASLELARRVTELGRVPDVILLADREVFPEILVPSATSWYAEFARNRMVLGFTPQSKFAGEITATNWRDIVQRPGVLVGRTDPVLAPAGYRALLTYRLAERFYKQPGLAVRLEKLTPPRLIRANAADLAGLLAAGELDYIVDYESLAHAQGLRFVALPTEIDLSDPNFGATYAAESVSVHSLKGDKVRVGAPILYAASIPRSAPHRPVAERFLSFLLYGGGRELIAKGHVDMLAQPRMVGDSIPQLHTR